MGRPLYLKPPFSRRQLDDLEQAERVAAALLAETPDKPVTLRRAGDPPGVTRDADKRTVRVDSTWGLVVNVRGYLPDGTEDRGLRCNSCPLADLRVVEQCSTVTSDGAG